jgi:hypothetical protein
MKAGNGCLDEIRFAAAIGPTMPVGRMAFVAVVFNQSKTSGYVQVVDQRLIDIHFL